MDARLPRYIVGVDGEQGGREMGIHYWRVLMRRGKVLSPLCVLSSLQLAGWWACSPPSFLQAERMETLVVVKNKIKARMQGMCLINVYYGVVV